jgi:hypothetical protein
MIWADERTMRELSRETEADVLCLMAAGADEDIARRQAAWNTSEAIRDAVRQWQREAQTVTG